MWLRHANARLLDAKFGETREEWAATHDTPDRYREIQQALADKGYYTAEVNGAWDSASIDALNRFKTDQKLRADGKLCSLSLIALGLGPKYEAVSVEQLSPAPVSADQR